jgi:hypothetical protein
MHADPCGSETLCSVKGVVRNAAGTELRTIYTSGAGGTTGSDFTVRFLVLCYNEIETG